MTEKKLKGYIILTISMMRAAYAAIMAVGFIVFCKDMVNSRYFTYTFGAVRYLTVFTVTNFRYLMRKNNSFEDDEFLKKEMKALNILVNIPFFSNFLFALPVFFLDMKDSVYPFIAYCIMISVHFYSMVAFGRTVKYMRQKDYF